MIKFEFAFLYQRNLHINDTYSLCMQLQDKSEEEMLAILSSIEGPWSFIYYSVARQKLYFGRDVFGRKSLLWTSPSSDYFILSSVSERQEGLREVPALGIYSTQLKSLLNQHDKNITLIPYDTVNEEQLQSDDLKGIRISKEKLKHNIKVKLCKDLPSQKTNEDLQKYPTSLTDNLLTFSAILNDKINLFAEAFKQAIEKRITACPHRCKNCTFMEYACNHSRFAVLFSGGLDSAVIALFLTKCLPVGEPIDLLNVSFTSEQFSKGEERLGNKKHLKHRAKISSPDRESGLACWKELQAIDSSRQWNFVEVMFFLSILFKLF